MAQILVVMMHLVVMLLVMLLLVIVVMMHLLMMLVLIFLLLQHELHPSVASALFQEYHVPFVLKPIAGGLLFWPFLADYGMSYYGVKVLLVSLLS